MTYIFVCIYIIYKYMYISDKALIYFSYFIEKHINLEKIM